MSTVQTAEPPFRPARTRPGALVGAPNCLILLNVTSGAKGGKLLETFRRSSTRRSIVGLAAIVACVSLAAAAATVALADPPPALFAGGQNGIVFAHGAHGNPHGGRSRELVFHGGPVMASGAAVTSIFWGSTWSSYSGDKISGIDSFYA